MRMLMNVEIDTQKGNEVIAAGKMDQVMQSVLGKIKPEQAYFYAKNGRRAFTLIVDCPDEAALPSLAEPLWIEMGAHVEAYPCMDTPQLIEGLGRLGS